MASAYGAETSRTWKVVKKLIPKKASTGFMAFLLAKIRLRMLYLYFYAWQNEYAVIGMTDKSEYSVGIYDEHGDGANDITLLRHLYKTQIKQLAEYMGLPEEIVQKPHTGDVYGNLPHETMLGISYKQLDMLLYAIGEGYPDKQLAEIIPKEAVKNIKQCMEVAGLIRRLPLSLD